MFLTVLFVCASASGHPKAARGFTRIFLEGFYWSNFKASSLNGQASNEGHTHVVCPGVSPKLY